MQPVGRILGWQTNQRESAARAELRMGASNWLAWYPNYWSLSVYQVWVQLVQPFFISGMGTPHVLTCKLDAKWFQSRCSWELERAPCTCALAVALPPPNCDTCIVRKYIEMHCVEIHCQDCTYMLGKFQRYFPINYQVIVIFTKLATLLLARDICIRRHPHITEIVQYLVEMMKLPYKKYHKWIVLVKAL